MASDTSSDVEVVSMKMPKPRILSMREDIRQKYQECLENFKQNCTWLVTKEHQDEKGDYCPDFLDKLDKTAESFHDMRGPALRRYPIEVSHYFRREVAAIMHEMKLVPVLCTHIAELLNGNHDSSEKRKVLECCMKMIMDYCQCSADIVRDTASNDEYMDAAADFIMSSEEKTDKFRDQLLKWTMYQIVNLSRVEDVKDQLWERNFVLFLSQFVKSSVPHLRLAALAGLANISMEKDAFRMNAGSVSFLINKIKDAMGRSHGSSEGWPVRELVEVLGKLARHEKNRRLLVQQGCLPLLTDIANADNDLDDIVALTALWHLALPRQENDMKVNGKSKKDKKKKAKEEEENANQKDMVKETNLVHTIARKYEDSQKDDVKFLAAGILFVLKEELEKSPRHQDVVQMMKKKNEEAELEQKQKSPSEDTSMALVAWKGPPTSSPDGENMEVQSTRRTKVMLSYNRNHRNIVEGIRSLLMGNGYDVWFDMVNMTGKTLNAMASAITSSDVICIFYSRSYQASPACELEAKYAQKKGKPTVFIKVEKEFQLDGWLDILMSDGYFIDLSGKYNEDERKRKLLEEVSNRVQEAEEKAKAKETASKASTETTVAIRK